MEKHTFQIYTGDGKGKTTAAFGLALRAAGWNLKTLIIQFLKGKKSGERKAVKSIPEIKVENYGSKNFIVDGELKKEDKEEVQRGFSRSKEALKEDWDILILDEINVALYFEALRLIEILDYIEKANDKIELVFTGRNAPKEIIEKADLVTEMKVIKHPYNKGFNSRKGIEY